MAGLSHPACQAAAAAWLPGSGQHAVFKVLPAWCHCCPMPWAAGQTKHSFFLPLPALSRGKLCGGRALCLPHGYRRCTVPHCCLPSPRWVSPSLHKRTQTVAQDKVQLGKCNPSPAAVSPGMGLQIQQCSPSHSLAWLDYACAMGQFQVHRYSLSQAGSCQAETATGSWMMGPGGTATLLERPRVQRGFGSHRVACVAWRAMGLVGWSRCPAPSPAQRVVVG